MGGFGSGRRGDRRTADDMRTLDVRRMARDGLLKPGTSCSWNWTRCGEVSASIEVMAAADGLIWLSYRQRDGGDWRESTYPVELDRTACHMGGERLWWRCPVVGCGRRVALLFAGNVFACRHCHQLTYASQSETPLDRAIRHLDRLRERLGWEPGFLNGMGGKPKGMSWRVFARLQADYAGCVERVMADLKAQANLS